MSSPRGSSADHQEGEGGEGGELRAAETRMPRIAMPSSTGDRAEQRELHRAIGRVTVAAAEMEQDLLWLLRHIAGAEVYAILSDQQWSRLLSAAQMIARERSDEALLSTLDRAGRLQKSRNELVHSLWTVYIDGTYDARKRRRHPQEPVTTPWTVEQIDLLAQEYDQLRITWFFMDPGPHDDDLGLDDDEPGPS